MLQKGVLLLHPRALGHYQPGHNLQYCLKLFRPCSLLCPCSAPGSLCWPQSLNQATFTSSCMQGHSRRSLLTSSQVLGRRPDFLASVKSCPPTPACEQCLGALQQKRARGPACLCPPSQHPGCLKLPSFRLLPPDALCPLRPPSPSGLSGPPSCQLSMCVRRRGV